VQDPSFDVVVAGAGLGGACAALWLSTSNRVLLLSGTATAASGVAAGLVNPFAGQRVVSSWHADLAYKDLLDTLAHADAIDTYDPCGILRPALNETQAVRLRTLAQEQAGSFTWLSREKVRFRYPCVSAPFGAAITIGGIVDTPRMLEYTHRAIASRCTVLPSDLVDWEDFGTGVNVALKSGVSLRTSKLILALGAGYRSFPVLSALNLHCIKGQIVRVRTPECLSPSIPVSGHGYIVPLRDSLILGATYEHSYQNDQPTKAGSKNILALTQQMIPCVETADVLDTVAGIRVGVPGTRLPMVGPLSGNVWILTGLGSKGLLYGAHIGRTLINWITNPEHVPNELSLQKKQRI
jgi:glycine oxidase